MSLLWTVGCILKFLLIYFQLFCVCLWKFLFLVVKGNWCNNFSKFLCDNFLGFAFLLCGNFIWWLFFDYYCFCLERNLKWLMIRRFFKKVLLEKLLMGNNVILTKSTESLTLTPSLLYAVGILHSIMINSNTCCERVKISSAFLLYHNNFNDCY